VRFNRKYESEEFWYNYLVWEHTARCWSTFRSMYQPWEVQAVQDFPADEDDDDYDDNDEDHHVVIVKKEEEDANVAGADQLPPEYEVVLATAYDEEALMQQALAASKVEEDAAFHDLQEAMRLT
jgi:hypothetical protein